MNLLSGKKFLITGLSSNRSIAYGIAKSLYYYGAQLAFSYQKEKLKDRVENLALKFNSNIVIQCDVSKDESIDNLFYELKKIWPSFDGFIHSIAYSPKEEFSGDYLESITRNGFTIAHDISSYSFVAMAKSSKNMLSQDSSLITLTYIGSERAIPNYNVMGLAKASLEANTRYMANSMGPKTRVNAISSGPIYTLASSAIKNFKRVISYFQSTSPMKRMITIEDIGNVAVFLCSNLSSGVTGEIIHVDGGFSITSMNEINILN